jgi:hypothetical protein
MAATTDGDSGEPRGESPGEGADGEVSLRRIEVLNLALIAAAALLSLGASRRFFWGVVAGGALNAANFRIITGVVRSMFLGRKGASALNAGLHWFSFAAVLGVVGALILWVRVDGVGFVVGLTTLLAAVALEGGLRLVAKR